MDSGWKRILSFSSTFSEIPSIPVSYPVMPPDILLHLATDESLPLPPPLAYVVQHEHLVTYILSPSPGDRSAVADPYLFVYTFLRHFDLFWVGGLGTFVPRIEARSCLPAATALLQQWYNIS